MAHVALFYLELHQMDIKTAFLNGDIDETIYMVQPENFVSRDPKSMVCKLKKSIYGLKQASRQWYHKFHQVITSYSFEANVVDDCVYHKFSESKYIFLVLYVNDILLASSDIGLLHETKKFLMKKFEMKDLGDASFVLGIQILRDLSQGILGLSKKSFIDKVLSRFDMKDSRLGDTPISKGDKFSSKQCLNNDLERKKMQKIPYVSVCLRCIKESRMTKEGPVGNRHVSDHISCSEYVVYIVTDNAANYVAAESILAQKDPLKETVTSSEWTLSAYAKESKRKRFVDDVFDSVFWKECATIVQLTKPLVRALWIVDSDEKLSMGYMYEAIHVTKNELHFNDLDLDCDGNDDTGNDNKNDTNNGNEDFGMIEILSLVQGEGIEEFMAVTLAWMHSNSS
ncbi:uncharacterized protein LOC111379383 [Olea europaea var. sylvestris]|uniref:uncharacterized protein LOC111379383 n=1 Tax=Olea europaea var. sylvestris TaxID=158386 RepID=UPI000C1D297F|nr:uncharacterized protein LOC111379383 [Olea europaea var. sylvestris]